MISRFCASISSAASASVFVSPVSLFFRLQLSSGSRWLIHSPLAASSASSWSSIRAWCSWFIASSSVGAPPFSFFRSRLFIGYPSVFVHMRILRVVSPPSLSSCSASIVAIHSLPSSPMRLLLHFFVVVLRFSLILTFIVVVWLLLNSVDLRGCVVVPYFVCVVGSPRLSVVSLSVFPVFCTVFCVFPLTFSYHCFLWGVGLLPSPPFCVCVGLAWSVVCWSLLVVPDSVFSSSVFVVPFFHQLCYFFGCSDLLSLVQLVESLCVPFYVPLCVLPGSYWFFPHRCSVVVHGSFRLSVCWFPVLRCCSFLVFHLRCWL